MGPQLWFLYNFALAIIHFLVYCFQFHQMSPKKTAPFNKFNYVLLRFVSKRKELGSFSSQRKKKKVSGLSSSNLYLLRLIVNLYIYLLPQILLKWKIWTGSNLIRVSFFLSCICIWAWLKGILLINNHGKDASLYLTHPVTLYAWCKLFVLS